ncbi:MAG TPA: hypothetical protein VGR27_02400, partial [Longimicrobiaceae bacterium]|nr:hypothetical protein [Longimicrobiaceae bacterium]
MRLVARCRILVLLLLAGCASLRPASVPGYTVEVDAGGFDREETPVSFSLPEGASGATFRLVDESGWATPVQLTGGRRATFILDRLTAGATRRYRLEAVAAAAAPGPGAQAQREEGAVILTIAGQPVLRYNASRTSLPRPEIDPV